MTIDYMTQVPIPISAEGLEKFEFSANTTDGVFAFSFWYFLNQWNCWVTLPTGEKRPIGIYAGNLNWARFLDYSILIVGSNNSITFDDILDIGVYIIKWL
jgi:hypothetical protein